VTKRPDASGVTVAIPDTPINSRSLELALRLFPLATNAVFTGRLSGNTIKPIPYDMMAYKSAVCQLNGLPLIGNGPGATHLVTNVSQVMPYVTSVRMCTDVHEVPQPISNAFVSTAHFSAGSYPLALKTIQLYSIPTTPNPVSYLIDDHSHLLDEVYSDSGDLLPQYPNSKWQDFLLSINFVTRAYGPESGLCAIENASKLNALVDQIWNQPPPTSIVARMRAHLFNNLLLLSLSSIHPFRPILKYSPCSNMSFLNEGCVSARLYGEHLVLLVGTKYVCPFTWQYVVFDDEPIAGCARPFSMSSKPVVELSVPVYRPVSERSAPRRGRGRGGAKSSSRNGNENNKSNNNNNKTTRTSKPPSAKPTEAAIRDRQKRRNLHNVFTHFLNTTMPSDSDDFYAYVAFPWISNETRREILHLYPPTNKEFFDEVINFLWCAKHPTEVEVLNDWKRTLNTGNTELQ
jgi:hypothetical protein